MKVPRYTRLMNTSILYRRALLVVLILSILLTLVYYDRLGKKSAKRVDREYPSTFNRFLQHRLKVDRTRCTEADLLRELQQACPRLPIRVSYEMARNEPLHYKNKSCAPFPSAASLKINNVHWQILETRNGSLYLFGAYYDVRKRNPFGPSIRLLGMINRCKFQVKTYCQMWFADRSEPIIVEAATDYRVIWNWGKVQGLYYPYLITCPVPITDPSLTGVPIFVSLVERGCDAATNSLRVIYNAIEPSARKDRFALCVKNLDALHVDMSVRLIEWIELVKILGARKVSFYVVHNHENNTKVLRYYKERGDVEVTSLTHAGHQLNVADFQRLNWSIPHFRLQQQLNELVSLNDCFYRNMYRYDYIAIFDCDEVIMPLKEDNWSDLMSRIEKEAAQSKRAPTHFTAKNILFDPNSTVQYSDIPSYLYMLQHVQREVNHLNRCPKSFFDTESVETVHNHWPISGLNGSTAGYEFAIEDAQLNHYRNELYLDFGKHSYDSSRVNDTVVWRYKSALIDRCLAVMYDLGFFG